MPATYTPLRYPGGKAKFGGYLSALLKANRLIDAVYAEPYAGGAGAGLFLLFRGYATRLRLNDIDPAVVAFWRAVLGHNERFADRIERVPLTVKEWDRQKRTLQGGGTDFDAGFAFFYLNRTNRSGIMNAGVIGGRDQSGEWGIGARFNRNELAARVRAVGTMRRYISVSREDALGWLDDLATQKAERLLVYLDPPYFGKGRDLYTNFYTAGDHAAIAKRLGTFRRPWVLTYDDCPQIRRLYTGHRVLSSEVSYSARAVRRGREVVVLGPRLNPPVMGPTPARRGLGFRIV